MNTRDSFIRCVIEQFGFAKVDAVIIYNIFIQEKVLKVDKQTGGFTLTHGAYWDKDVMNNALDMAIDYEVNQD